MREMAHSVSGLPRAGRCVSNACCVSVLMWAMGSAPQPVQMQHDANCSSLRILKPSHASLRHWNDHVASVCCHLIGRNEPSEGRSGLRISRSPTVCNSLLSSISTTTTRDKVSQGAVSWSRL
jgi:hypothetical protein